MEPPQYTYRYQWLARIGSQLLHSSSQVEQQKLRERMRQAGYYWPPAAAVFMAIKMLATFLPLLLGLAAYFALGQSSIWPMGVGMILAVVGTVAPTMWLMVRCRARRSRLRRGLPTLATAVVSRLIADIGVVGALQSARDSVAGDHPQLAHEIFLTCREIELSKPVHAALKSFGQRTGLDDLASILAQFHEDGRIESVEAFAALHARRDPGNMENVGIAMHERE